MTNDELLQVIEQTAQNEATQLNLAGKKLMSLPPEIGRLIKLRELNLSRNYLTTLPPEIGQLNNLGEFYCSSNQLISLPAEIGQLTNLNVLNLGVNRLKSLPPEIGQLPNLKSLDLDSNRLMSLPVEIGQLANLNTLDVRRNQLTSLPTEIGQLTQLIKLYLIGNRLTILPAEIGQLVNLYGLYLSDNQLTDLPSQIGQLTSLHELHLRRNKLTSLPVQVGQLQSLQSVDLRNNPLETPPLEILEKGIKAIQEYFRQFQEAGTDRLYEAKLLIIGEGGAGKTTLAKKIQDPDYQLQEDEISTDGIEIIQYRFMMDNDKEFRVNIWDFGGQQIYHETHQFFLTKRSLYVLVADARKEDTDFYYWLNVVELLSGNSPLLIVKNEKQNIKLGLNERQLRGEFTNLKETIATNFADNRGLTDVISALKHYIKNLPHVGTELPKTWIKVREALEQESHNYISLDTYLKICQDNGFIRREDKLQLSDYLHDLGVCLHFQEDDLLSKTVILKPTWGTDAAYKVLRHPQVTQNLGRFTREDLASIWNEDKYATMRPELLRLMMNFKLCYEIPSHPGNYITPQLLSPEQPEYEWNESKNLLLRYEYEFMPKGILTRFIVEMHQWIEEQTCVWKTGVVLSKANAKAEVIELYRYHKGEIRIRVSGKRPSDLLTAIRHELDKIHDSYKSLDDEHNQVQRLKYKTLVPCRCNACKDSQSPHFYPLQVLHKFLDDQRDIQCPNSYDMVNVRGLVDEIAPETSRLTNDQKRRLEVVYSRLQSEWDLVNEKLTQLRHERVIATDAAIRFQLDQQIQADEAKLPRLIAELEEIEHTLNQ